MEKSLSKSSQTDSNFFKSVWEVVSTIPSGKVATYGQVAKILGTKDARKVGWALHANNNPEVPCHRVVNKEGGVAPNFAFDGWKEQKRRLTEEGVGFVDKTHINLGSFLWKA